MKWLFVEKFQYLYRLLFRLFTYGIELWGVLTIASTLGKQINLLIVRIERLHIIGKLNFREIVTERDRKEIGKNSFKIERNEFELLLVRTEHYKRSFLNRCLFEFV